jgi:hypothetical protein
LAGFHKVKEKEEAKQQRLAASEAAVKLKEQIQKTNTSIIFDTSTGDPNVANVALSTEATTEDNIESQSTDDDGIFCVMVVRGKDRIKVTLPAGAEANFLAVKQQLSATINVPAKYHRIL